ncbi:MAG: enoyl-CoA hydratase/isomerase family protein [bacterium]|nr:enoyl-CoA hydratase/isomerase family protein [bacterium]
MKYETIKVATDDKIARVTLDRPDVHNAFNLQMLLDLIDAFGKLGDDDGVRVVVLTGEGKSFCAGADLKWMSEIINYSFEQNLEESNTVANLMEAIFLCPKPTIARVNGAAIGGGTGLVAACDIAVAAQSAKLSLSEVKLGLVPACISPYVIRRVGESRARELFLSGERLTGERAAEFGLVNYAVPDDELDAKVDDLIGKLLTSGPEAIATCKELLQRVPGAPIPEIKGYTAECIARMRISEEGQEGMAAFFEKRKPDWAE